MAAWAARGLFMLAVLMAMSGCSNVKELLMRETSNAVAPTELTEFEARLKVGQLWSKRIGKGADDGSRQRAEAEALAFKIDALFTSVAVDVTAVAGDTHATVARKLADRINVVGLLLMRTPVSAVSTSNNTLQLQLGNGKTVAYGDIKAFG